MYFRDSVTEVATDNKLGSRGTTDRDTSLGNHIKILVAWRLEDRGGERFEKYLGDGIDDGFEVVGERKKSAGFTEVTGCMLISHCI